MVHELGSNLKQTDVLYQTTNSLDTKSNYDIPVAANGVVGQQ